ncbi:sigma-54 interaction domain-containing protein [Syntrophotalea acetylenica]|uniref:Fis family transcriptional regulator n=1 Tax=Syntrophotalea acetylenica TaxID=29542 RepID=A0A1L3GIW8_SYNAC|nr:sigma 54-interacting transcriptional regulator [Syntrophotalea acetylenica]APG25872.1 Fis family transcriptional regulator [Syntrophotalea acetylenica]APG43944.1 Fis family transcriptional regulator [Syntrophotalea acetylenica]
MHQDNQEKEQDIILDSINEGVFTVDRKWRITSFNRAAEKITGIKREQALGRPCCEVFRANICEKACALRQTMEKGASLFNETAHIINQAGQRIPIRISTALLKNDQGDVVGGVETFQDLSQVEQLRKELESRYSFEDIIGRSPLMMELFRFIAPVADSDSTVLIEGASGTGKELFARAIHNLSPRHNKPFVAVNCAALPDTLLESELFGYKAGAFTDARRDKPGRFACAHGGTLFLDEIGDISPAMQVRLLRVLQERCFEPLGSVKSVHVDVRILAATNKNLAELVHEGVFREDLFYRIRVIHLQIPGLQKRKEDIPLLVKHFVAKFNRLYNRQIEGVSHEVLARLMDYDYPGNVRELENILEHAFVLCRGGMIEVRCLPLELRPKDYSMASESCGLTTLQAMEQNLIFEALKRHSGNRTRTAEHLGIDTSTLYRKIKSLGIKVPATDGRSSRSR